MSEFAWMSRRHALAGATATAGLAACQRLPQASKSPMTFKPDALATLEANLKANVATGQPPGLVALISRGRETHAFPVGALSLGGPAVPRDAIFRLASMTKPITAVAAMMLVEDGRLKLDEPIERLAPELTNRRAPQRPDG